MELLLVIFLLQPKNKSSSKSRGRGVRLYVDLVLIGPDDAASFLKRVSLFNTSRSLEPIYPGAIPVTPKLNED